MPWIPISGHPTRNTNPLANPTKPMPWFIISRGIIISHAPTRVDCGGLRKPKADCGLKPEPTKASTEFADHTKSKHQ